MVLLFCVTLTLQKCGMETLKLLAEVFDDGPFHCEKTAESATPGGGGLRRSQRHVHSLGDVGSGI